MYPAASTRLSLRLPDTCTRCGWHRDAIGAIGRRTRRLVSTAAASSASRQLGPPPRPPWGRQPLGGARRRISCGHGADSVVTRRMVALVAVSGCTGGCLSLRTGCCRRPRPRAVGTRESPRRTFRDPERAPTSKCCNQPIFGARKARAFMKSCSRGGVHESMLQGRCVSAIACYSHCDVLVVSAC